METTSFNQSQGRIQDFSQRDPDTSRAAQKNVVTPKGCFFLPSEFLVLTSQKSKVISREAEKNIIPH